jgi:hypothetical protein
MTNKEKLISLIGFAPSNGNVLIGALQDVGLVDTDTYVVGEASLLTIKKAKLQVLRILYSTPDTTTSNAGVVASSIKYDRDNLKKDIESLEVELGLTVAAPYITTRPVW